MLIKAQELSYFLDFQANAWVSCMHTGANLYPDRWLTWRHRPHCAAAKSYN